LTVRVENAGRPSIHVGGEVTLNTSATIIKVGQDHGTSSVADLMVGDVLRVDLEPVSDGQAELADDHQDGINGPQGEDELLAAHRVVRVGGIGPAAVETDG
jgi:hypothetical protein